MGELRGSYRVHFGLALALCGAGLLCMASTWLPDEYTVPKWLVVGLSVAMFPVAIVSFIRTYTSGATTHLINRNHGDRFIKYVLALPLAIKLTYVFIVLLAVLGFATGAGAAKDAQADASGYYYTYWDKTADPQHSVRVELTEPEYHEALKGQLRIFSAAPLLFNGLSSFLVLASASAAAARTRTAPKLSSRSAESRTRS
ncbi:hypothetical protein ACIQF6_19385 [Kitasatospora sp. NPDC092948]|uniref:hypothetical protein n=1 Tax=Kitasatospora sp. NPDC092948 TaxID=3364088 RepID=UPI003830F5B1